MFLPLVKPILRIAALVVSIIIYALTILSAYGGRFDTEFFTFPAMMTLAMPWFATATLIITILWFCFRRIFAGGLGVLTIIASWGPISSSCPLGSSKQPEPDAQTFTLMTFNMIHGWDQEGKNPDRNRAIDFIIETNADIVCLQEADTVAPGADIPNFTDEQYAELQKLYPYRVGDPSLDMKVLSKYPAVFERGYNFVDGSFDPKRYTFYKLNVNGHRLTIINVHLLSFLLTAEECRVVTNIHSVESAKESYRELKGNIREKLARGFKKRKHDIGILRNTIDRMKGPLIICGDFNDVPESYAYRMLKGEDLKDAYVETGFGPLVTYNKHAFWFHLDQILYRGGLKALNIRKGKTKASDHYPLIAEFEFTDETDTK